MSTVETRATVSGAREESFADRGLALVAMAGAVGGAITGAVLGTEAGVAFPVLCGALGTMLGSLTAAGGWCLFVGDEADHAAR